MITLELNGINSTLIGAGAWSSTGMSGLIIDTLSVSDSFGSNLYFGLLGGSSCSGESGSEGRQERYRRVRHTGVTEHGELICTNPASVVGLGPDQDSEWGRRPPFGVR